MQIDSGIAPRRVISAFGLNFFFYVRSFGSRYSSGPGRAL